ncbi:MAG: twin-arginine translocation signal domain-containing protein [Acidobacteria bacterium]|nr:twin-arginine translocation signal domain-containing protein [Acidobacteriota bacterium]
MGKSRREFLGTTSAGLLAALAAPDLLPAPSAGALAEGAMQ